MMLPATCIVAFSKHIFTVFADLTSLEIPTDGLLEQDVHIMIFHLKKKQNQCQLYL